MASLASFAGAQANLLVNGDFESGNFVPNGDSTMVLAPGSTDLTGWDVFSDNVAWIGAGNPFNGWTGTNGPRGLDLTSYDSATPHGGVQQSFNTVTGAVYSFSFDLGAHGAYTDFSCVRVVVGNFDSLFAVTNSGSTTQLWQNQSGAFVAQGTTTTISILGIRSGLNTAGNDIGLDNVVVEAVPEPASITALVIGCGAVLRRRRK